MKIVLKIGGNEIDDSNFLDKVAKLVARIQHEHHNLVMVHGGGKEITQLLAKLNMKTKFVKGLRYTDLRTLMAVEMVLSGLINKRLVRSLQQNGVNAFGLSGVDGKILVAKKMKRDGEDVGFVGEVETVNVSALQELMQEFVVVLSPISIDSGSLPVDDPLRNRRSTRQDADAPLAQTIPLNVNADYAAAAVAMSLKCDLALFLSNVHGVLKDGTVIPKLHDKEFLNLKDSGIIEGGMIPKIEAALRALRGGTKEAFITDADGAEEIIEGRMAGTEVVV